MKILTFILLGLGIICLCYNYFTLQPLLNREFGSYGNARFLSDMTGMIGTAFFAFGAISSFMGYRKSKDKLMMIMVPVGLVLALVCFLVAFGRVI